MIYRKVSIVLLVCLGIAGCGGGGGGMDSSGPDAFFPGAGANLLGLDLAGTPRAQPSPTMGALEAFD